MKEIMICENNLVDVYVIKEIVEIYAKDRNERTVMLKITKEAWEEVCIKVIEDMEKGASPGEGVE